MRASLKSQHESPFLGLKYFDEETADLFFGRDEQIDELLAKLKGSRFVTVIGSSGSGKSSLVRAGLIPGLRGGYLGTGSEWRIATATPGNDPIGNLARALTEALGAAGLEQTLRRGPLGLIEAVQQARLPANENVLIVGDQFEELFRFMRATEDRKDRKSKDEEENLLQTARGHATAFVKLLLEAAAQRETPIYVVITMRSDFLGECSQFRDLPERINEGLYLIPRMRRDQIEQAVTGPVRVVGSRIKARLVERLLNDLGDSQDQLPVLQHALLRTWNQRPAGEDLDLVHYSESGGLENALGRHADEIYGGLSPEQQTYAKWIFRRLTEVDGSREIRRPTTIEKLAEVAGTTEDNIGPVLDPFESVFFLRKTGTLVDLTHESLIRQWGTLRGWAADENVDRKDYEFLAELALRGLQKKEWLAGGQLTRAEEWLNKGLTAAWAVPYEGDFQETVTYIKKSIEEAEKARQQEKQRVRKIIVTSAAVTVVITILGIVAAVQWKKASDLAAAQQVVQEKLRTAYGALQVGNEKLSTQNKVVETANQNLSDALGNAKAATTEAQRQRTIGLWQSLLRDAVHAGDTDEELAALLARQAALFHQQTPGQTPQPLDEVIYNLTALRSGLQGADLKGHSAGVNSVAFSRDSQHVVSGADDRTVRVWDLSQAAAPPLIFKGQEKVIAVAYSADGNRIFSGDAKGEIRIWNPNQPDGVPTVFKFKGPADVRFSSMVFSGDGQRVAMLSRGSVSVWELRDPDPVPIETPELRLAASATLAPSGQLVAMANIDGSVTLLDLRQRGASTTTLSARASAPAPSSSRLANPFGDSSVAFSADNRFVASADNSSLRIWDLMDPTRPPAELQERYISSPQFSRDGHTIGFVSNGDSIRVWNFSQPMEASRKVASRPDSFTSLALSADGKWFVGATGDTVVVRSIERRTVAMGEFSLESNSSFSLSKDARFLSMITLDKTVRVLDLRQASGNPTVVSIPAVQTPALQAPAVQSPAARVAAGQSSPVQRQLLKLGPDGQSLLKIAESSLTVWDLRKPLQPIQIPLQSLVTSSFSADTDPKFGLSPDARHLATVDPEGTTRVWDLRQDPPVSVALAGGQKAGVLPTFSPDGQRLAVRADEKILVWDLKRPQGSPQVLSVDTDFISQLAFSSDGLRMAGASGNSVLLWDLRQASPMAVTVGLHDDVVDALAFSPDGQYLASGGEDGKLRLWYLNRQLPPVVIPGDAADEYITDIAFSPDGMRLVFAGDSEKVRNLPFGQTGVNEICLVVHRNLSREEWKKYVGAGQPYQSTCPNLPPGK